nr:alpha/beta hydrolase [Levilactobacillus bambusae]
MLAPLAGVAATSLFVSEKLFSIAMNRVDDVPETSDDKKQYAAAYYHYLDWLAKVETHDWFLHQHDPNRRMHAIYIPAKAPSNKFVIISHGYKGNGETMSGYAKMFYDMGFSVLLPDDRAHGKSAGKYISFGWLDRLDYLEWINTAIKYRGETLAILLFGVSMGGATVEMLSGENLPTQVKAIIADCGYSSIAEELTYILTNQYHLPKYPFEPMVSTINRRRLGYYLGDVSSTDQLAHNTRPILFIHGEKDAYVPPYMSYKNYAATHAPKQLWLVRNASHAESFWIDTPAYQHRVAKFLHTYFDPRVIPAQ